MVKATTFIEGVTAFKEIFPTTGYDAVGKVVDISNPVAEFMDRTIPATGESFATGNGHRIVNFDLGQGLWKRFTQGVALIGEATSGIASITQTVGALKSPFSKRPTKRDEIRRDVQPVVHPVQVEKGSRAEREELTNSTVAASRQEVVEQQEPASDVASEGSSVESDSQDNTVSQANANVADGSVQVGQTNTGATTSTAMPSDRGSLATTERKEPSGSSPQPEVLTRDQFNSDDEYYDAMEADWLSRVPNRFEKETIFDEDDYDDLPDFAKKVEGYYADDITEDLRDVWAKVEFADEYAEYLKDHDDPMTESEQYWYDYFKKHVIFVDRNNYDDFALAPEYTKDQLQGFYHSPELPENVFRNSEALTQQWMELDTERQAKVFESAKRGVAERVRSDAFRQAIIRGVQDAEGNLHHDRLQPNIIRTIAHVLYRKDEFIDAQLFKDVAKIMYAIAKKPLRDGEGQQRLEAIVSAAQTQVANAVDSYRLGQRGKWNAGA